VVWRLNDAGILEKWELWPFFVGAEAPLVTEATTAEVPALSQGLQKLSRVSSAVYLRVMASASL